MPVATSRRSWETRTRVLAWRINTAIWLEHAAPPFFYAASAAAVSVFALRRLNGPVLIAWLSFAALAVGIAFAVGWRARKRYFSPRDARVFLESQLRLDTRLTAASAGLVP